MDARRGKWRRGEPAVSRAVRVLSTDMFIPSCGGGKGRRRCVVVREEGDRGEALRFLLCAVARVSQRAIPLLFPSPSATEKGAA